jgi:multidrug resistance efflux pump
VGQNPFPRTLRSLEGERSNAGVALLAALLALLCLWLVWFFAAEVPVYVVSEAARIESQRAAYPISAQVGGRVRRVAVSLGQTVKAGDVLFELEADVERQRAAEERARLAALARQLASRREQRADMTAGLAPARRAAGLSRQEARERQRAARASAALAADELARKVRLHAAGLVPDSELARARTEAERRLAEASELAISLDRLAAERRRDDSDRRAAASEIDQEIALLEGSLVAEAAVVRRLEAEGRWRSVRAPLAGRVGELARLDAGAVVQPGERLGTLIPEARLAAVGEFSPAALGRIRPGQRAEVRLDAFPWTEHGAVPARVARVSGELRDGRLWVDLALAANAGARIPLQHGLPGSVLVETGRLSPASLLLQTLGMKADPPAGGQSDPRVANR